MSDGTATVGDVRADHARGTVGEPARALADAVSGPRVADARRSDAGVTASDVLAAQARLRPHLAATPLHFAERFGSWLKLENLQRTGSYKVRGAMNALLAARERGDHRPIVAASAGNHAQGLAWAGYRLRHPVIAVMPRTAPQTKIAGVAHWGATVRLHGDNYDEAKAFALALAQQNDYRLLSAFDDPDVIAGQGTVGLEMLRAQPDLEVLAIAVGGGGLIGGIATAAKALKPGIEVVGVQTQRFPAMVNAMTGQHLPQGSNTIAEGIAVASPGERNQALARARVDDWLLVDEGDIEQAIVMLLEIEKTLVEGAGAAGLAAVLKHPQRFAGKKVGLVLCGGNIDPLLLASIIERGMVRAGRLARIQVNARDVPGNLARITALVAEAGANIDEVHHQRAFTLLAAQNVEIELVLQTRGREHVQQVIDALTAAGFAAHVQ